MNNGQFLWGLTLLLAVGVAEQGGGEQRVGDDAGGFWVLKIGHD